MQTVPPAQPDKTSYILTDMKELPKKIDPQFSAEAWKKLKACKEWKALKPAQQNDQGLEGCLRDLDAALRTFARDCTVNNAEQTSQLAWSVQNTFRNIPPAGKTIDKFIGDLRAYVTDIKLRALIHAQEIKKMARREEDDIKTMHAKLVEGIRARNEGIDDLKRYWATLEGLMKKIEKNDAGSAAAVTAAQNTIRDYKARVDVHQQTIRTDVAKTADIKALNSPLLDALLPKYQIYLSKYIPLNQQIIGLINKIDDIITQRSLANANESELMAGIRDACAPLATFVHNMDANTAPESITEQLQHQAAKASPADALKLAKGKLKGYLLQRDRGASKATLAITLIKQAQKRISTKANKDALKGYATTVASVQKAISGIDAKVKKVAALLEAFKKQHSL